MKTKIILITVLSVLFISKGQCQDQDTLGQKINEMNLRIKETKDSFDELFLDFNNTKLKIQKNYENTKNKEELNNNAWILYIQYVKTYIQKRNTINVYINWYLEFINLNEIKYLNEYQRIQINKTKDIINNMIDDLKDNKTEKTKIFDLLIPNNQYQNIETNPDIKPLSLYFRDFFITQNYLILLDLDQ